MVLRASLSRRLATAIVLPLAVVAAALGVGGAVVTDGVVERTSDRLLAGSLHAILETATVEDGRVWIDLPPWSLGVLDSPQRDSVFYSARQNGRLLTGYGDLPDITAGLVETPDPVFRTLTYRGRTIRVAAQKRAFPGSPGQVAVAVAQTYESRHAVRAVLWGWLAALEIALVVLVGLLVWPAANWSLRPLNRLRGTLDVRARSSKADFAPAPLKDVPLELVGVVESFNAVLSQLGRATERERRFAADASHQIRTPLTVLHTSLAMMQRRRGLPKPLRLELEDARSAADRLQRLLLQLLALARAENEQGVALGQVDLAALIRQVCDDKTAQATVAGVTLVPAESTTCLALANRELAYEIVVNLVDNAVLHGGPGRVELSAHGEDGACVLMVRDHGPGIAPEDRDHVMERFYRARRTRSTPGSGLGLPIVRALADRMGAALDLSETPGGGLSVSVRFQTSVGAASVPAATV